MSRRTTRRDREHAYAAGGSAALSLFEQVLALSAGRPVFTADKYTVDGISGRVRSWIDWNDPTHVLDQSIAAQQVPVPAAHADFAGALCATYTGGQAYQSNRAVAAWTFTADGVSNEQWDVFEPVGQASPGAVCATAFTGGQAGSLTTFEPGGLTHLLGSGPSGSAGLLILANPGASANDVPIYTSSRHQAAAAPQYELRRRGTLGASGPFGAPALNFPPQFPLIVGASGNPALSRPANMRWAATLFTPALTPAQRLIVETWIYETYGIVSPSLAPYLFEKVKLLAAGRPIFTADHYTLDGVSGRVRSFVDHNDAGHLFDQSVAAQQVAAPAPLAGFGGAACAAFTAHHYVSSRVPDAWSFLANDTYDLWLAYRHTNLAAGLQVPFEAGDGAAINNLFSFVLVSASDLSQVIDRAGASYDQLSLVPTTNPTILTSRITQSPPQRYLKFSGAPATVAGSLAGTPAPFTLPCALGARLGPTFQAAMEFHSLVITPATPEARATVAAWLLAATGLAA